MGEGTTGVSKTVHVGGEKLANRGKNTFNVFIEINLRSSNT